MNKSTYLMNVWQFLMHINCYNEQYTYIKVHVQYMYRASTCSGGSRSLKLANKHYQSEILLTSPDTRIIHSRHLASPLMTRSSKLELTKQVIGRYVH